MFNERRLWPLAAFLALGMGFWGLGWGLPSNARARLFLKPESQTTAFFQTLASARQDVYEKVGTNPIAHLGRERKGQAEALSTSLLSSYSSFLVRTHHGDEQQALVMLSRLNPLQGRWYPYTFQYGGAYVYPLAAYLGVLHALQIIRLVPDAVYYYAHPDRIAAVYLAARAWSVVGLMASVIPLFFLGRRLAGPFVGFWASCFYVLAPACIGNAKLVKPHVWAAAWTLSSVYFCVQVRQDGGMKALLAAAAFLGLAVGTTMSQLAFLPFLLWACWSETWRKTLSRAVAAALTSAAVFICTNFYLFAHLQDFRDEIDYYRSFSPFGIRLTAVWDFFYGCLRPSFGAVLWGAVLLSWVFAWMQRKNPPLRGLAVLWALVSLYLSFQVQAFSGDPISMRLGLALIGLGCVMAAWLLRYLPRARWICLALLGLLLTNASVYNRNFQSDRVPRDNASQAALWIQNHVPEGTVIGHMQSIPHLIEFPPIDFSRYRLMPIAQSEFLTQRGRTLAVIPDWAPAVRQLLVDHHFVLIHRFALSPLQRQGLHDPFTPANFALNIYERQAS